MTIRAAMARLSLPCRGSCRSSNTDSADTHSRPRLHRGSSNDQSAYEATSFHDAILDVDERKEIARILPYLEDGERVLVVARQSRVLPGATLVFTPDVVFCTAHRIIIRNPMMLGLREHIDYYRHRDVKSVRLVRGRFTSSLMLTVPGMGTAARSASGEGDGIISAIPHAKAEAIYRIIQEGGHKAGGGSSGGKRDGGGGEARPRTASSDRVARDGDRTGASKAHGEPQEAVAAAAAAEGSGGATPT